MALIVERPSCLQVYGLMEGLVAKQSFLTKLAEAQNSREAGAETSTDRKESCLKICTQQAEWWEAPSTGSDKVEAIEENLQNDTLHLQPVSTSILEDIFKASAIFHVHHM